LLAQGDNVVAQKAEEGFLSRRQERGRKYGAHGGLGMTNRGGRRPARGVVGVGKDSADPSLAPFEAHRKG
jgi:hypothetical protein